MRGDVAGDSRQTEQEAGNYGGGWATLAGMMHIEIPVLVREIGIRAEGAGTPDFGLYPPLLGSTCRL